MRKIISRYQFIIFSILTIVISISSWIIAKEQTGTLKILFTQFGYFGPAIVAIILTLVSAKNSIGIKVKSYFPFIVVFVCILIFAIIYGEPYYKIRIDKLLIENPLIIALVLITVAYFIYQFAKNKGNSAIDQLVNIPKTNILWYLLAVALYPFFKFIGVLLSLKLFPTQVELPALNLVILIPLFLFSIIFYAAIGEEIGWRGYALKKLQQKYNPLKATLFIGIVWSIWHIGYFILVENYSIQNIPGVIIFTFLSAFFCTWLFNKTKGNVLILILFHASVNFAILFVPSPIIMTVLHLILLVVVLITGRFFKKIGAESDN